MSSTSSSRSSTLSSSSCSSVGLSSAYASGSSGLSSRPSCSQCALGLSVRTPASASLASASITGRQRRKLASLAERASTTTPGGPSRCRVLSSSDMVSSHSASLVSISSGSRVVMLLCSHVSCSVSNWSAVDHSRWNGAKSCCRLCRRSNSVTCCPRMACRSPMSWAVSAASSSQSCSSSASSVALLNCTGSATSSAPPSE
mmetsp:Transcript_17210/g.65278  ORF Transcript_17210/g.65278 Transcript_17210/m.65278 type:complete len:201 (+) Transcript_17210:788-1390(+)